MIKLVLGDIIKSKTDCIVNAANKSLLGGCGVDGAIHFAAGPELLEECKTLNGCETGKAKITSGYNLPAKYIIHTVGPVYGYYSDQSKLLASCYKESLDLAKLSNLHSIAFPAISTGAYGYPIEEATVIAIQTIKDWLDNNDYVMDVDLYCFTQEDYDVYNAILNN